MEKPRLTYEDEKLYLAKAMEKPRLTADTASNRLYSCEDGTQWVCFEVDEFAWQEKGICSTCGDSMMGGYLCLDNGALELCEDCVEVVPI